MGKVFRRYNSTIYGNYRKAYLIDGALTGAVMSVILLAVDLISGTPMESPVNFIPELVMMVSIAWCGYHYRKELDQQKVTFKEMMLLGLGIGMVSAVVYGLFVWAYCCVRHDMVQIYQNQRIALMESADVSVDAKLAVESVKHYGPGDWGFIAGFRLAVLSIIVAFLAAIALRTEKAPIKMKNK